MRRIDWARYYIKKYWIFLKLETYELRQEAKEYIRNAIKDSKELPSDLNAMLKKYSKTKTVSTGLPISAFVVLLSVLCYNFEISYYGIFFVLYFILLFRLKLDSRIPIGAALVLLLVTPFYLLKNLENFANFLATLAYFFLVIGVIKQFVEYLKNE